MYLMKNEPIYPMSFDTLSNRVLLNWLKTLYVLLLKSLHQKLKEIFHCDVVRQRNENGVDGHEDEIQGQYRELLAWKGLVVLQKGNQVDKERND